jgi:hypothetical protein
LLLLSFVSIDSGSWNRVVSGPALRLSFVADVMNKYSSPFPSTSVGTLPFPRGRCENNTQNFVR